MLTPQASFAMREGDFPRAYLMLYRESTLVMNHLRTHPDYKDRDSRKLYKPLLEDIPHVVQQLERLKPVIQEQHDEYQRMTSQQPRPSDARAARRKQPKILDVADDVDLAVDIAQEELRKRDSVKGARRPGDRGGRVWRVPERDAGREAETADDLQAQLEATRRTLDSVTSERRDETPRASPLQREPSRPSSHTSHHYPPTSRSRPVDYAPERPVSRLPASPRPQRPPKEPSTDTQSSFSPPSSISSSRRDADSSMGQYQPLLPSRPDKTPIPSLQPPGPASASPPRPHEDALLSDGHAQPPALPAKESLETSDGAAQRVAFRPAAHLENGDPIRYVFLPSQLRASFLSLAAPNTARGLEMCGILCGTPVNNALFVTTLIVPEQRCTPDTCETVNESALLDYCIAEDLLMIGWIHTHPTQSCFMSSRDLHTQAGYQVMMPESIAIVCAPRFEPSYVPLSPVSKDEERSLTAQVWHLPPHQPPGAPPHPQLQPEGHLPPARHRRHLHGRHAARGPRARGAAAGLPRARPETVVGPPREAAGVGGLPAGRGRVGAGDRGAGAWIEGFLRGGGRAVGGCIAWRYGGFCWLCFGVGVGDRMGGGRGRCLDTLRGGLVWMRIDLSENLVLSMLPPSDVTRHIGVVPSSAPRSERIGDDSYWSYGLPFPPLCSSCQGGQRARTYDTDTDEVFGKKNRASTPS